MDHQHFDFLAAKSFGRNHASQVRGTRQNREAYSVADVKLAHYYICVMLEVHITFVICLSKNW